MPRSGLCAQFGFKQETTVGTAVTVDHFLPVRSFVPDSSPMLVTSEAVRGCALTESDDDVILVGQKASGSLDLEVRSKGMGLILGQILGSAPTPTQIAATARYRQIHLPTALEGRSLTMQAGLPESYSSTVRPHTYNGVKFSQATFTQQRNGLLTLGITWDAWQEAVATALATDSYATGAEVFSFSGFSAKIGGTASTSTGRTTVASNTELKGCRGATVTIANGLATDRYMSGGSGVKSEQLENGRRSYTVDLDLEYADRTQVHDLMRAFTTSALVLEWTGQVAIEASVFAQFRITLPKCKIISGGPQLGGPDILPGSVQLKGYEDSAGTHPAIQIELESADTTL